MTTRRTRPDPELQALAARKSHELHCRNLRLRVGGKVHATDSAQWLHGLWVPVPGCHTGTFAWTPDDVHATDKPVSCQLCLRLPNVREAAGLSPRVDQLFLDLPLADLGDESSPGEEPEQEYLPLDLE